MAGQNPVYNMTDMSREDQQDGMMFSEGNIDRSHTVKKRLLDNAGGGSMAGPPMKKITIGANGSPSYENQNLAYMDQESMMSFQKGASLLGPILDTSLGNQP